MRTLLFAVLAGVFFMAGCGGDDPAHAARLVIEPDDGRSPILDVIAGAKNNIRLTIYEITDLEAVSQTPAAPANSVAQALIAKAKSDVSVRLVVDQYEYQSGTNAAQIQQTVQALRDAGATVHLSSTAFCYTHEKTFVIDGPTSSQPYLQGTAIIMSLNLVPSYFGGTRDYAVITRDVAVVQEISTVFDSDFWLPNSTSPCSAAHTPKETYAPPYPSDTPLVVDSSLLWSPVTSKPKLLQLMAGARQSLVLTTEELGDNEMVCQIKAVAESAGRPSVRILLSSNTGSNGSAVKTLLGLGLPNLEIRVMPGPPTPPDASTPQTPLYMHGKQVIVDGSAAFVGSENLTNTSLIQNRELGIFFADRQMIERLEAVFASDFAIPGHSLAAKACTGTQSCETITCPATP